MRDKLVFPVDGPAEYDGICNLCGWRGRFVGRRGFVPAGQEFACGGCGAPLRHRDEAIVMLEEFGRGLYLTLDELIGDPRFRACSIYFVGELGPVRRRLATLPHYVESRYVPDAEPGARLEDRTTSQDLQQLTFADDSFDLVVSSHVMEHVPNPWQALAEVRRVLRPGGRYIFSIPFRTPALPDTIPRAAIENGEIRHLVEPTYHESPQGPALVFHDFGADLVDRADACGLSVRIVRPHMAMQVAVRDVVVVATRTSRPNEGAGA